MDADKKDVKVKRFLLKLQKLARKCIVKNDYEKAMAAISVSGYIQYMFNQTYTDVELEKMILQLAKRNKVKYETDIKMMPIEKKNVLFYDGFGLDTRGVALMYLNALKKNGYHIIYVTNLEAEGKQPEIQKIMRGAVITWKYISMRNSYLSWFEELTKIIIASKAKALFFYTKPNDVSGALSLSLFQGKCDRYLIDLTDHAFWIGTQSNDYFLGSREMSASNQFFRRYIPKSRMIKLGVNLIVEEGNDHKGLPFDILSEKYIFSGGSLYKTLGDPENTYYRILDYILSKHSEIKFLYAGEGDASQLELIIKKYPGQAFLIKERKDFYYLIKHCVLYLNTYPMFGGMMMKYAAYAGKIPITLRHNRDSDGLLLNQKQAQIEYDTYEELIADIDKLLLDQNYLKQREELLKGTVITEQRFVNNLQSLIETHSTDYCHQVVEIDTSAFQKEFYDRFELSKVKQDCVNYINRSLYNSMPWMYIIAAKKMACLFLKKVRR